MTNEAVVKLKERETKRVKNLDKKVKPPVGKIICYVLLALYTVWLFFPMYTIFATSFTSSAELTSSLDFIWFPKPTFESYKRLFEKDVYSITTGVPSLILGFFNTMWMTLVPLIIGLFVSGVSAYAFSKVKFKGREPLSFAEIIISVFPLGAFSMISYMFYSALGWVGTPWPIIVPGMFGGIGTIFFLRMYMDGVSDGLIEAAKIDGLGFWGIFFKIILPLSKPAFIAQFIFGFVGGYNTYMSALLYLRGVPELVTIQLVLAGAEDIFNGIGAETVHCAAAVLGMLPLIILYIFMQKYFLEGLTVGGEKE